MTLARGPEAHESEAFSRPASSASGPSAPGAPAPEASAPGPGTLTSPHAPAPKPGKLGTPGASTPGASAQFTSAPETAFVFDGTLEGLFSAVFLAYAEHVVPTDVVTAQGLQPRLGQEVREVATDMEAALRVQAGICARCGAFVFEAVKCASVSDDPAAGTIIYNFLRYALRLNRPADCTRCPRRQRCGGLCTRKPRRSALSDLTHPAVAPFIALNRAVSNERQKVMQFLRFEHMEGDLWFARCNPKASVVPLVMDWFSGRFNTQAFMIYDEVHEVAGVWEGHGWTLVRTADVTLPRRSGDEQPMQAAWRRFYNTIAVESRYNPELRRHLMPKRLWRKITEMQEELPVPSPPTGPASTPGSVAGMREGPQTPVPSKAGMKLSLAAGPSCQK